MFVTAKRRFILTHKTTVPWIVIHTRID